MVVCMHRLEGGHRPPSRSIGIWLLMDNGNGRKFTEKLKILANGWQIWRSIEGLAGEELEERKRLVNV